MYYKFKDINNQYNFRRFFRVNLDKLKQILKQILKQTLKQISESFEQIALKKSSNVLILYYKFNNLNNILKLISKNSSNKAFTICPRKALRKPSRCSYIVLQVQ